MKPHSEKVILERLRHLIEGRVEVAPATIHATSRLADLGIDSFALIELVFQVEEEFDIVIPLEGLDVKTVADVVGVITSHLVAEA